MAKIDLDAPAYLALLPTAAANFWPLLSASIFLTAATVAPDLVRLPEGTGLLEAFDLSITISLVFAWVLTETTIAFAVYPTLLTGGVVAGYAALKQATFPRLATFVGLQFIMLLLMVVIVVLVVKTASAFGATSPDGPIDGTQGTITTGIALILIFLFGLAQPDVVMTGRMSLGMALRHAIQNARNLGPRLIFTAGPLWWASEHATNLSSAAGPEENGSGEITISFVMLNYASVVFGILGSVMAAIVLARVYRDMMPPGALLEAGRVSEVFD